MAVSQDLITRLKKMCAETSGGTFSSSALSSYIERYPVRDEWGQEPFAWNMATVPPARIANANWVATYDLNAAAADVWQDKASALAGDYDFSADGASYNRSQAYDQAMKQARYYASHRVARTSTLTAWPTPAPEDE